MESFHRVTLEVNYFKCYQKLKIKNKIQPQTVLNVESGLVSHRHNEVSLYSVVFDSKPFATSCCKNAGTDALILFICSGSRGEQGEEGTTETRAKEKTTDSNWTPSLTDFMG